MILGDFLDLINKDKREKERIRTAQRFAVGIGVVAAVGVATGIVFAPKSGKQTREDLKKKAEKTVETIKKSAQKSAESVKTSAEHAEQKVSNVISKLQN